MVKAKSPEQISEILKIIYKKSFTKKRSGDYRMTKDLLREIIGGRKNKKLKDIMEKVHIDLYKNGYVLVDLENSIFLFNKKRILSQRIVPRSTVKEFIYVVDDDEMLVTEKDIDNDGNEFEKLYPELLLNK